MKNQLLIICFLTATSDVLAQSFITMPASGAQTINAYGGTFYDSGGPTANYTNNENGVLTICPAVTGQYIVLNFVSFVTEVAADLLSIYNGPSIASPIISPSPLYGSMICISPFVSTDSSGCLTMRFISNGSNTNSGWTANFGCSATTTPSTALGAGCSFPVLIPFIPFTDSTKCTDCLPNSFQTQSGICNTTYAGSNRVYRYDTSGPECDSIIMSNTSGNPALAIYQGCPGAGGTCVTSTPMVGNNSMQFTFPSAATYFIIIDEVTGYSCYDLKIIPCATGINEPILEDDIAITQNFSESQITFRSRSGRQANIVITDALGHRVQSVMTGSGVAFFSTKTWVPGIYLARMSAGEKTAVKKFIIK